MQKIALFLLDLFEVCVALAMLYGAFSQSEQIFGLAFLGMQIYQFILKRVTGDVFMNDLALVLAIGILLIARIFVGTWLQAFMIGTAISYGCLMLFDGVIGGFMGPAAAIAIEKVNPSGTNQASDSEP